MWFFKSVSQAADEPKRGTEGIYFIRLVKIVEIFLTKKWCKVTFMKRWCLDAQNLALI